MANSTLIKDHRSLALEWWRELSLRDRLQMFRKHFSFGQTCLMDLDEYDIELVYIKEVVNNINDKLNQ